MHGDHAQRDLADELARGLNAAARLIELRAAAIRAGFPSVQPDEELSLVADAIRKMAVRLSLRAAATR